MSHRCLYVMEMDMKQIEKKKEDVLISDISLYKHEILNSTSTYRNEKNKLNHN